MRFWMLALLAACGTSPTQIPPPDGAATTPLDAGVVDQSAPSADLAADLAPLAGCPQGSWCSALFPPDWTANMAPDSMGRFLHDFSYAGYRNGEAPPTSPPGALFDVVAGYGADPTATSDSTAAIQGALTAASTAGQGIVYLPAGTYRVDGQLTVTSGHVVVRGAGPTATRIYFTKWMGMGYQSHLAFRGTVTRAVPISLAVDGENRSKQVRVLSATGLAAGDEIAIGWTISDDFIAEHGMTGTWTAFNGTWRPMFRRTIVSIDTTVTPNVITLDVPLRYPAKVRDQASIRKESGYLSECGIEELSVSNAVGWDDAWSQHQVHALSMSGVKDCWMRNIGTFSSPLASSTSYHLQSSGLEVVDSKRVTVTHVTMHGAQNRGSGGDGYLFEISRANEILTVDSVGSKGRHNFIQNWDFGTTGCVWLRCDSSGGGNVTLVGGFPIELPASSEFHHSLAMANLVDQTTLSDGWLSRNRGTESTGAGQTSTEGVIWNARGAGRIQSMNYGWGYVIGTSAMQTNIETNPASQGGAGTLPEDHVEGVGMGATLWPQSLYEEQRARRLLTP